MNDEKLSSFGSQKEQRLFEQTAKTVNRHIEKDTSALLVTSILSGLIHFKDAYKYYAFTVSVLTHLLITHKIILVRRDNDSQD